MDLVTSFLALALVGFVIGLLSGILGVGGGTIMVPVFRLFIGLSAIESTATSLFTIVPTSLSGALTRIREKTCVLSLGLTLGLGGALTSPVGVWLASISPGWLIMVAAALVIAYSAVSMFMKAIRMKGMSAVEDDQQVRLSRRQLALGLMIGAFAGLGSGYIGVGGGFLMVPLMVNILGVSMKEASGTSLVAMVILAIPGVVEHVMLGNIDYLVGVAVALGSIPGAIAGAHLVKKIPERVLRFTFSFFLLIAAGLLAFNEFHPLG